ncbi:helix-turn-helix domain-containing protein [Cohnella cellulosilytica]|uniref:Helix-turn-helix domain-containing protein n=1 Tax=Cohnella cellulosilytica TaxID=986710 RepID=A0ABW2F314_9BACL
MNLKKMSRNRKLYTRILIGITLCIVAALVIASYVYYYAFARILQKETFQSDLNHLRQTSQTVARTSDNALTVSSQIYRNGTIAKLLYYKAPDAFDIQAAMLDLDGYLATMPFIQSIYVYHPDAGYYIVSREGQQRGLTPESLVEESGINEIVENFHEFKPFTPIPRTFHYKGEEQSPRGAFTYLLYDAIGFDRKINSAIIVNVSADWVNYDLGIDNFQGASKNYFIDDQDNILSVGELSEVQWGQEERLLIKETIQSHQSGYTIADFEGVKSLITYTSPDKYGWQYVRITPYEAITAAVTKVRSTTLQIATVILGVGLMLSWLLSRFLYVPIHKIESRVEALESERRDSSYTVRQNMLRKLVQMKDFNPEYQLDKLQSLNISFDFTRPYMLAHIRIDGLKQLKDQGHNDLLTYKFAIMNIASEICSKFMRVEAVDLEENGLLLMMNALSGQLPGPELQLMFGEVQHACKEYLNLSVTVAYSPYSSEPLELHYLFKEAHSASQHRFFLGTNTIIASSGLDLSDSTAYAFPVGKEKRMIDALIGGKNDEAKALFEEIMQETAHYPPVIANVAAKHLTVSLTNMITEIERNGSLQLGFGPEAIPDIAECETLEELTERYYALFEVLKLRLVEKRSGKQEELTRRITELIETQYADPNLSLNYIAEELNMSPYHISRVYRHQTLNNIVDRINQVRMDKAKELLIQSEHSVAEIAERTGYTNSSYFHRIFKKINGVTPSEFRKAGR